MFFAFWELRLKRQISEDVKSSKIPSNLGLLNDISESMKREHFVQSLPKMSQVKLKKIVLLKFLFVVLLITEVILLHRA